MYFFQLVWQKTENVLKFVIFMAVLAPLPKTSKTDMLYPRGCAYIALLIYWNIFFCSQLLEGDKMRT